ncbi:hypothetical protein Hanom_Chr16g01523251 [Helianthus anomalus]
MQYSSQKQNHNDENTVKNNNIFLHEYRNIIHIQHLTSFFVSPFTTATHHEHFY